MTRILFIFALVCLMVSPLLAQSLVKQADREFGQLAYAQAIGLYEQALADSASLSDAERLDARAKLGYSYQQTRDMKNAERVYHDLIGSGNLSADYTKCYLFYAQALASNGKYREAQAAYDKYGSLQSGDKRSPSFSKLYRDVNALTRNAGSYKVEFLTMNTRRAEFSPMLYKDGLVFVSTGAGSGTKHVSRWNTAPFLDLYFLPDVKAIRTAKAGSVVGSTASAKRAKQAESGQLARPLGSDEYTAPTANDTRTVGFFGVNNLSMGYEDRPMSQSERFSRTLNTKFCEGPATFTKDGSRVIFTRNNTKDNYRDSSDTATKLKLYTATQTNGVWSKAEELPFNSNEFSNGHPALSNDRTGEPDNLLYFASDRPGGFGGTDIYVSNWVNGKWSEPVNLGKDVNTNGYELFPFIDEKNNIYFASDGRPGLGGLDLFCAQLSPDGQQGRVVRNLGEPLNSPNDDFGIVTDGDRTTGYFSSNRKNGGADDDVYRFTREGSLYPCRELTLSIIDATSRLPLANATVTMDNAAIDKQKELKTDDDGIVRICLNVDSDVKFLVSREGYADNKVGFSTKDLSDDQPSSLEILLDKPTVAKTATLRGRVLTQTDHSPIANAKVVSVNECDGTTQEAISGPDGTYEFTVQSGCAYALEAIKDNMGTSGAHVDKEGVGVTDILMFRKGDVVKIDNIYYDLDKASIRPDAAAELDKVVALLAKCPAMTIEMRSHTDSRATATYNKTLSGNRAKAAIAYLKAKGVAAKRVIAKGYGESTLINKCKDGVNCPEEEHQQNRRTEIKILKLE